MLVTALGAAGKKRFPAAISTEVVVVETSRERDANPTYVVMFHAK